MSNPIEQLLPCIGEQWAAADDVAAEAGVTRNRARLALKAAFRDRRVDLKIEPDGVLLVRQIPAE